MSSEPPAARHYTCAFCDTVSAGDSLSCTGCGAPADVSAVVAPSGWVQMPSIVDMARLEFGHSSLQIEGLYVPVADFSLSAQDGVYFTHHVLLWKDPQVPITVMSLSKGWTRLLGGLPLVMAEAHGPGHIAFSRDTAGEMMALPLSPGQAIDVREHVFVAATASVTYDWFSTNVWFRTKHGDETESHYPVGRTMDRFQAGTDPGIVVIHGGGNVFEKRLGPGESILVKPTALLFKEPTVEMHFHIENPANTGQGGWRTFDRYLWLRLYGPGRVAIQSAFEHLEDQGQVMIGHSPMTSWRPGLDGRGGFSKPADWFYREGAEKRGPLREDQIQGLVLVGRLAPDAPVWREGLADWIPARRMARNPGSLVSSRLFQARARPCPHCGTSVWSRGRVTQQGWIIFLVLLVLCFPLCWIGLLLRDRTCPKCGKLVP